MSERIFRKKSLEKIKSPDNLNDYIHIANPSVWLLLIAVIFILIGACIWGFFGKIETSVSAYAYAEDGIIVCFVDKNDAEKIDIGMKIKADDFECEVISLYDENLSGEDIAEKYGIVSFKNDKAIYTTVKGTTSFKDGIYKVRIIIESIHPFSFVLN